MVWIWRRGKWRVERDPSPDLVPRPPSPQGRGMFIRMVGCCVRKVLVLIPTEKDVHFVGWVACPKKYMPCSRRSGKLRSEREVASGDPPPHPDLLGHMLSLESESRCLSELVRRRCGSTAAKNAQGIEDSRWRKWACRTEAKNGFSFSAGEKVAEVRRRMRGLLPVVLIGGLRVVFRSDSNPSECPSQIMLKNRGPSSAGSRYIRAAD